MTNIFITEQEFLNSYNKKKEQATKRAIDFTFTLEEWKTFIRLKYRLTCAYTNQKFVHKGDDKFNPTIERIDQNSGYTISNSIWVTKQINGLKNTYMELGKSQKGLCTNDIGLLHRVQKILNKSDGIETILKPYKEVYSQLNDKLTQEHSERMKDLAKQAEELNKKVAQEEAHQAKKDKIDQQRMFATHYLRISDQFQKLDLLFDVTMKEFRDMLRVKNDRITGTPFSSMEVKNVYVVNKSLPITKENCIVVHKTTQEALDHLTGGNQKVLRKSVSNLVKII